MDRHRMRGEGEYTTLPRPAAPQLSLGAFILCPVSYGNPLELFWQQELYRWALLLGLLALFAELSIVAWKAPLP